MRADSNPINIYLSEDLDKYIISNEINADILIREGNIKSLSYIIKINGHLDLHDSIIESLGDLKEITGDFCIFSDNVCSNLKSLEQLENIGGNLILKNSNIENLGALKRVGGLLNLRDTNVTNLGKLEYIGGDLYLPKKYENIIDLSDIIIRGKVRYWNDDKFRKKLTPKENMGYMNYQQDIPYFDRQSLWLNDKLHESTEEQQQFYDIFKAEFLKGNYIDLQGNYNYASTLLIDLLNNHYDNPDLLQDYITSVKKYYPVVGFYGDIFLVPKLEELGCFEDSWKIISKDPYVHIYKIVEYEKKLGRALLTPDLMIKLCRDKTFTDFGKANMAKIKPYIDMQLERYKSERSSTLFDIFLPNGKPKHSKYYKDFFICEEEFYIYEKQDKESHGNYWGYLPLVVIEAITNQCRQILRQAEDLYRESIGMPKIGCGWLSEAELFHKIADCFTNEKVVQHASPKWLGRQHLDIYFPKWNIAIEYQGIQHYKPVDFFGGEETFEKNKERDIKKESLCKKNNCYLIYADEGYDFIEIKQIIEKYIFSKKNSAQ